MLNHKFLDFQGGSLFLVLYIYKMKIMFVLQKYMQEDTHFPLTFKAMHNGLYETVLEINLIDLKYVM